MVLNFRGALGAASGYDGKVQVQPWGENSRQLYFPGWLPSGQPHMVHQRPTGDKFYMEIA